MRIILTGTYELECTEEMEAWSIEDKERWALAHLEQDVSLRMFDWESVVEEEEQEDD